MRVVLLIFGILALAAGGAFFYTQILPTLGGIQGLAASSPLAPVSSPAPVAQAPALSGIGALGYIEPRSRVLRVSHDSGPDGARIDTIEVDVGQVVQKDDTIAVFSDYGRKLAKRDAIAKDIPRLQADLKAEHANLEYAQNDYNRIKDTIASAITINTKEKAALEIKRSQAEIQSLESQIGAAQANLVLAEEELVQSRVVAPIGGTILAVHARPGERVGDAGIVEMADLDHLDVVAEIYERDISRVKIGQVAEITVPGVDTPVPGKVYEIGHMVQKNTLVDNDPLSARDLRVIPVRIEIAPGAPDVLKNMLKLQVSVRLL